MRTTWEVADVFRDGAARFKRRYGRDMIQPVFFPIFLTCNSLF